MKLIVFETEEWEHAGCLELQPEQYQGQTTNFQTPGGGFAPVFAI